MAETRRRLARLGLSWREPARLWDVDVPKDLERLEREGLAALCEPGLWTTISAPSASDR
jgi:hypothetical protein